MKPETKEYTLDDLPENFNLCDRKQSTINQMGMRWVWSEAIWMRDENVLCFDCPGGYLICWFFKTHEVYTKSMFLYPNLNSVNKKMRKGKIYRSTEKKYFIFWRLSAGFSLWRNRSMFIFYLYFLNEILRNSKAKRQRRRKKHVSDRESRKLDSWDRWQNLRFIWGTGRSSTGPERKVLTEESTEVNSPEFCISETVFILPLNMNAILFIEFLSHVRFPHNILQVC